MFYKTVISSGVCSPSIVSEHGKAREDIPCGLLVRSVAPCALFGGLRSRLLLGGFNGLLNRLSGLLGLSLGGLLLAAEMLGGSGYLLWSGVAGVVTGALTWLLPLSWEWQGTLFAVLTLLAAWLWSKWLRKRVKTQRPADAQLNQRGQQLVGRRLTLDAPLVNGRGHVRVGDSSWPVIADEDFAAGSKVEVIAVEGITLRIRPAVR